MASSLEVGLGSGQIDCRFCGLGVGHERGRSHNAQSIAFHDRAIYARGQAKIICVDNEATHWVSLTKPFTTKDTKEHKGREILA